MNNQLILGRVFRVLWLLSFVALVYLAVSWSADSELGAEVYIGESIYTKRFIFTIFEVGYLLLTLFVFFGNYLLRQSRYSRTYSTLSFPLADSLLWGTYVLLTICLAYVFGATLA
jgi:hypothetical protein